MFPVRSNGNGGFYRVRVSQWSIHRALAQSNRDCSRAGADPLTSVVSDVLGLSGRRILHALIEGVTDPTQLAELARHRLRSSRETLANALTGRITNAQRLVLKMQLEEVEQMERHMDELEHALAQAQATCQDAMERLFEIPGVSARAAQQIIAEIGPEAEAFDSAAQLASWVGVSPGREESVGVSTSIGLLKEIASCAVSYRTGNLRALSVGFCGCVLCWKLALTSMIALASKRRIEYCRDGIFPVRFYVRGTEASPQRLADS